MGRGDHNSTKLICYCKKTGEAVSLRIDLSPIGESGIRGSEIEVKSKEVRDHHHSRLSRSENSNFWKLSRKSCCRMVEENHVLTERVETLSAMNSPPPPGVPTPLELQVVRLNAYLADLARHSWLPVG